MSADGDRDDRRYRFGPLERRGLVGGLSVGQIMSLAGGCLAGVAALRLSPTAGGFALALTMIGAGLALAFAPAHGRTPVAWVPVLVAWLIGRKAHRSRTPVAGMTGALDGTGARRTVDLPDWLHGCELITVAAGEQEIGVVRDRRLRALTAVLAVKVRAVGLVSTREHDARLAHWGELLAGLARSGGPLRRVQILQRALPADSEGLWRHYFDARDQAPDLDSELDRSYRALLAQADHVTQDREVLLAVQIDERRAWARAARDVRLRQLSKDSQSEAVLVRELRGLVGRFTNVDAEVAGVLTAEQYATAIRNAYDPFRRSRLAAVRPEPVAPAALDFAPTAAETRWRTLTVDGACHRSYWIAQWPRVAVGPLFLTPLLLGAHAVHSVSVLFEPIEPDRARRGAEAAITSDEADEELRRRRGFRTSAVKRRQQDAAVRREEELASGHEELRFAGYVTVSARFEAELDDACAQVEQAAEQARLDILPLWGEQETGFVHGALPIGRGLASARVGGLA